MLEINYPSKTNLKSIPNHRDVRKKECFERKKNLLHLILKYLLDNNLTTVAESLQNEAQINNQYQVCDNIDLDIILQEYQSYYSLKFSKEPKILRKLSETELITKKEKKQSVKEKPKPEKKEAPFTFQISPISNDLSVGDTLTKSLCDFENYSAEWREMADQITKQIVHNDGGTHFGDCIGLSDTIERLKEAIVYPVMYPTLFQNVRSWRGILLYGPPGTGKTLLAKALACDSPSRVINVTCSSFISKWRGDSEKMVKTLFDIAKMQTPTTVFIDEIDALASANQSNHEASRRFRSELLTQLDGIVQSEDVFILATTNTPWSIDAALLRRFDKRILVPLPDMKARLDILRYYFRKYGHGIVDLEESARLTENFSGSDLQIVCKEVEMALIREKLAEIKKHDFQKGKLVTRKAEISDVMIALDKVKPCIGNNDYCKYIEWTAKFGAK